MRGASMPVSCACPLLLLAGSLLRSRCSLSLSSALDLHLKRRGGTVAVAVGPLAAAHATPMRAS